MWCVVTVTYSRPSAAAAAAGVRGGRRTQNVLQVVVELSSFATSSRPVFKLLFALQTAVLLFVFFRSAREKENVVNRVRVCVSNQEDQELFRLSRGGRWSHASSSIMGNGAPTPASSQYWKC